MIKIEIYNAFATSTVAVALNCLVTVLQIFREEKT
jgi:hypothetical protein